jgi:hypothetical protein
MKIHFQQMLSMAHKRNEMCIMMVRYASLHAATIFDVPFFSFRSFVLGNFSKSHFATKLHKVDGRQENKK